MQKEAWSHCTNFRMKEAGLGNGKYGLPWYCFDPPLNCSPALVGWGCFSLSAWFIPLAILQTTSFPAITPCRQPACPPPLDLAASVAGASSSALRDALRKKKEKRKKKALRSVFFLRVVVGRGYATFPTIQSGRRRRPLCILLPIPSANKAAQTKRGRGDGWGRALAKY